MNIFVTHSDFPVVLLVNIVKRGVLEKSCAKCDELTYSRLICSSLCVHSQSQQKVFMLAQVCTNPANLESAILGNTTVMQLLLMLRLSSDVCYASGSLRAHKCRSIKCVEVEWIAIRMNLVWVTCVAGM